MAETGSDFSTPDKKTGLVFGQYSGDPKNWTSLVFK
jgi:hypothetical protein